MKGLEYSGLALLSVYCHLEVGIVATCKLQVLQLAFRVARLSRVRIYLLIYYMQVCLVFLCLFIYGWNVFVHENVKVIVF